MKIPNWQILLAGLALGLIPGLWLVIRLKSEGTATETRIARLQASLTLANNAISKEAEIADEEREGCRLLVPKPDTSGVDGARTILQATAPLSQWVIRGRVIPQTLRASSPGMYRYVDKDGKSTVWFHAEESVEP